MQLSNVVLAFSLLVAEPVPSIELAIPQKYQGNVNAEVIFVDLSAVPFFCGAPSPGRTKLACMLEDGKTLVLPNPCTYKEAQDVESYAHLACHEKAHILGWDHTN